MIKDYLPVGTIVTVNLNNEIQQVLIIGRTLQDEQLNIDFMGVKYPRGFKDVNQVLYFNEKEIINVVNIGYYSGAEQRYSQVVKLNDNQELEVK